MSTFAARLREERERLGLNQTAFGEACGVKKLAQLKYEQGASSPDASYLLQARELGVDLNYIFTGARPSDGVRFDDLARLRVAIESVEEGLSATRKLLDPASKAELIAAAYELVRDEAEEQKARTSVVRMLRLVA